MVYTGRVAWGRFEIKAGGWIEYSDTEFAPLVSARFAEGAGGRLELVELHMGRGGAITGEILRRVNPGRLEAAANSPDVAAELRLRISQGKGSSSAGHRFLEAIEPKDSVPESEIPSMTPSIRLAVPEARKKPDEFYRSVAASFAFLSRQSEQPARDLAEANEVPVTTVHRWVKEARRRGLLAPARRSEGER